MKTVFFLSFFIYSSALFSQIPITSELIDCMSGKKVKGYVCLCERNDFGNFQSVKKYKLVLKFGCKKKI